MKRKCLFFWVEFSNELCHLNLIRRTLSVVVYDNNNNNNNIELGYDFKGKQVLAPLMQSTARKRHTQEMFTGTK